MNKFSDKRIFGPMPNYPLVKSYEPKDNKFTLISGPCSVESDLQINQIAKKICKFGVTHLRGGVFSAGTFPSDKFGWKDIYLIQSFQNAANQNGMKNIVEILDYTERSFEDILKYADCVQIGARSMQNYTLLKKAAEFGKPVFLKRHPGSTLDEFLGAAEYLLKYGCKELTLIERGSVSHTNHCRWDLSVSMIPAVKSITKIPIIGDPSHGTGRRDLVGPLALACVAAGSDGLLIETHFDPDKSISDKEQAIHPDELELIINKVNKIRKVLNA